MDNLDAKDADLGNATEPNSEKIDVIHLSPEDWSDIKQLESQAIIGNSEQIRKVITEKYPQSYRHDPELMEKNIKRPAWGHSLMSRDGEFENVLFVNTEIVKNSKIIPIILRHESVENVMQDKALDIKYLGDQMDANHEVIEDIADQIGIDPEVVENDPNNSVAHYIAMYHEIKFAFETGFLDDILEFRRQNVAEVTGRLTSPTEPTNSNASLSWRQKYKSPADEYAMLNLLVSEQMAKKIRP